jgi:hypothetical protein
MHGHVQASPASLWEGLAFETSVGGNSLFVAFIGTESVTIALLWRLSTPIVGINSLGLFFLSCSGSGHPKLWEDTIYPGMKQALIHVLQVTQGEIEHRKVSYKIN